MAVSSNLRRGCPCPHPPPPLRCCFLLSLDLQCLNIIEANLACGGMLQVSGDRWDHRREKHRGLVQEPAGKGHLFIRSSVRPILPGEAAHCAACGSKVHAREHSYRRANLTLPVSLQDVQHVHRIAAVGGLRQVRVVCCENSDAVVWVQF